MATQFSKDNAGAKWDPPKIDNYTPMPQRPGLLYIVGVVRLELAGVPFSLLLASHVHQDATVGRHQVAKGLNLGSAPPFAGRD